MLGFNSTLLFCAQEDHDENYYSNGLLCGVANIPHPLPRDWHRVVPFRLVVTRIPAGGRPLPRARKQQASLSAARLAQSSHSRPWACVDWSGSSPSGGFGWLLWVCFRWRWALLAFCLAPRSGALPTPQRRRCARGTPCSQRERFLKWRSARAGHAQSRESIGLLGAVLPW